MADASRSIKGPAQTFAALRGALCNGYTRIS